jgi:hypothetical protein
MVMVLDGKVLLFKCKSRFIVLRFMKGGVAVALCFRNIFRIWVPPSSSGRNGHGIH